MLIVGCIAALLALLALRVVVLALLPAPPALVAQTATPSAAAPAVAPAVPAQPSAQAAPRHDPAPAPTPTQTEALAQPTVDNTCPEAITLDAGQRAGWLARVAGCPEIAMATVDGSRQWVIRTNRLSDDVYNQLPEVSP
jgi:hypothetical protein